MAPLLLVLALAAPLGQAGDLGSRLQASAAAAQALQGELDGGWTLTDAAGRPLLALQFTDPGSGPGALGASWRRLGSDDGLGVATAVERRDGRLDIALSPDGPRLDLTRRDANTWTGWLRQGRRSERVRLSRQR